MPAGKPQQLVCEYARNPLGIDTSIPRFSWNVSHTERGQKQTAYQIVVSSSRELPQRGIGDLWDSGEVTSESFVNQEYAGPPLASFSRYYWKVRWWDSRGEASPYSDTAEFETAMLERSDWKATWITKKKCRTFQDSSGKQEQNGMPVWAIYLRKEFQLKRKVQRARIYVCGIGYYELRLNGTKVGDHALDPAQTDYRSHALYVAYDVTGSLLDSRNAIGVILGNGRHVPEYGYGKPKMILQMLIEYTDGESELILSNERWKACHGPLMENGIYYGERYDARLEMPGWDYPGFDESKWEEVEPVGGPVLSAQMMPPVRATRRIKPLSLYSPAEGAFVYDFGQNFSGLAKLIVRGPKGTEVKIKYAEIIDKNGKLKTDTNRGAGAQIVYILKGQGEEEYEPRFTYSGFRYVEIRGFPGVPTLDSIEGVFIHTDVTQTGTFLCSNQRINKIHECTLWGQLSNLMSVPTDCPQRAERMGWLGDAHLTAEEAVYNFDMACFYTKFLRDIRQSQQDDGSLPDVAPAYWKFYPADPAWGSAYITIAWHMYFYYGDKRVLEEHYEPMKKYIDYLGTQAENNLLTTLGKYGDWCPPASTFPKRTPVELTSNWYYYHDVLLLSKIAGSLGRKKEAEGLSQLASRIKTSFNKKFLDEGMYSTIKMSPIDNFPGQTSQALPLYLDMVPQKWRRQAIDLLLKTVVQIHDCHIDTGIIGTRYLFEVLRDNDQADLAYTIVNQESYPGWGYMLAEGATTLWERWERLEGVGMNSHNHIMFGTIDAWFYRTITGIIPLTVEWQEVRIKPHFFTSLNHAAATLKTIRGVMQLSWQRSEGCIELFVDLPVGMQGQLYLPLLIEDYRIEESGIVFWESKKQRAMPDGISSINAAGNYLICGIGSGEYQFVIHTKSQ